MRFNDPGAAGRDLAAVVDIGSNSVRLVISDLNDLRPGRYMLNEKVMCRLGVGLSPGDLSPWRGLPGGVSTEGLSKEAAPKTVNLDPQRRAYALNTLRWFSEICSAADCRNVMILATAALRTAKDADSFVEHTARLFNAPVNILSGEEEARTAAAGVAASIFGAAGPVADLGGGSLDIAPVSPDKNGPALSLPTGTLILKQKTAGLKPKKKRKAITDLIYPELARHPWIKADTVYLVGGTWRALALEHIRRVKYPLTVVHRYQVPAKKLRAFCKHTARMTDEELSLLTGVVPRRREVIREAATVLEALIHAAEPRQLVFAGTGVREGFLHKQLDLKPSAQPEIDAARRLVVGGARFSDPHTNRTIGDALYDWSADLRGHFSRIHQTGTGEKTGACAQQADALRKAACQLAEFGWSRHPSYKAAETASLILHSNRLTHSHTDRAYLALCLFRRYGGQKQSTITKGFKRLLPGNLKREANVFGLIIRIAMSVSSGIPSKLAQTRLSVRPAQPQTPGSLYTASEHSDKDRIRIHIPHTRKEFPIVSFDREIRILERKYGVELELRYDL